METIRSIAFFILGFKAKKTSKKEAIRLIIKAKSALNVVNNKDR